MKRWTTPAFLLLVVLSLFSCVTPSPTPTGSVISAGLAAKTGKELIEEAEAALGRITAELEAAGIRVTNNAGESVNLSIHNFRNSVDSILTKQVGQLSIQQQQLAYSLEKVTIAAQKEVDKSLRFGDMALLSLEETVDDSLLGAFSGKHIIVQAINGRAILEQTPSTYSFEVIATDIGTGGSGVDNNFSISIDGKSVEYVTTSSDRHARTFEVDDKALEPYFIDGTIVSKTVLLSITQSIDKLIGTKVINHDVNVNFVLYPKQAGVFTVSYEVPQFGWENIEWLTDSTSNSCHNCKGNGTAFAMSLKVVGGDVGKSTPINNERLVNLSCECKSTPGLCWFDRHGNAGKEEFKLTSDKSSATCSGYHRTKTTLWELKGLKQRYINKPAAKKTMQLPFAYNDTQRVAVPAEAVAIRLTGSTMMGESINVGLNIEDDKSNMVDVSGNELNGLERVLFVTLRPDLTI